MIYLISKDKKQYKANLHCHSTFSDGKKTPEELKEMYKSHGYSILAITDHETPKSHSELSDDDFLMLTGYEAYIRPSETGTVDHYGSEIHMNLFARDPKNEKLICYNPCYVRYLPVERHREIEKVGSEEPRQYSVEYINKFIKTAKENGYIVSYNHYGWSMEDEAQVLAYEGFFSMEMFNYDSSLYNGKEYNAVIYDKMLKKGKRVFCHSADDNHNKAPADSPYFDSFGGFAMIMPESLEYSSVYEALEKGEFYSSMGPVFNEISFDGETVHVECSPVKRITLHVGNKLPPRVIANEGEYITSADFKIVPLDPRMKYIRVNIIDEYAKAADTRGYFIDEFWEKLGK